MTDLMELASRVEAGELKDGDLVRVKIIPSWTADTMRLAKSERVGRIDRLFTPTGGSPVARVIFPKEGRYKERIEYFKPSDLTRAHQGTAHVD